MASAGGGGSGAFPPLPGQARMLLEGYLEAFWLSKQVGAFRFSRLMSSRAAVERGDGFAGGQIESFRNSQVKGRKRNAKRQVGAKMRERRRN